MLDAGLRVGEAARTRIYKLIVAGQPVTGLDLDKTWCEKKCDRIVPVSPRLREAIEEMNKTVWTATKSRPEMPAFFDKNSTIHISVRQVERIIASASFAAFGRFVHPHILRHTFATNLLRVTDIKTVQYLLGHKHLSSTQVYTHTNGQLCQDAINKLHAINPSPSSQLVVGPHP
jgi:integrase/recombinase XerC